MRICLVYDCLFPYTVGGAERWYRNLGERLAADGHEVTYLTLRQWGRDERGEVAGVRVVSAGPRMQLYVPMDAGGCCRRSCSAPACSGTSSDTAAAMTWSTPHRFPTSPCWRRRSCARCSASGSSSTGTSSGAAGYWREYLGPVGGRIGQAVQALCLRVPQRAFCFSHLHARRLRAAPVNGELTVLEGEYAGPLEPREPAPAEPLVVFAGRHIPEKRVPALVPALALARERLPELRGEVLGDGPDREKVLQARAQHGLEEALDVPGFVSSERVESSLARAMCMLLPSRREGYGMVVIEAAAVGTPSVVVADPDNAAADLVSEGENGYIAPSASPEDLAAAIERVHADGQALRERTASWFRSNARAPLAGELAREGARELRRGQRSFVARHGELRGPLPGVLGGARESRRAQPLRSE